MMRKHLLRKSTLALLLLRDDPYDYTSFDPDRGQEH